MSDLGPETANATPENLSKLARLIAMGQPLQSQAVAEAITLCVAAWEADRGARGISEEAFRAATARIEALERRVAQGASIIEDLAVDCESGIVETEADEHTGAKVPRATHDVRIARRCRRALAALRGEGRS